MKKKILLFASTILASMAFAVSASAALDTQDYTESDATAILKEALQHTLTPADADYVLYDIDGNKPDGLAQEVTANDAALAFKKSIVKTQFYIEVKGGVKFSKDIALSPYVASGTDLEDYATATDVKIKDMVEDYLALNSSKAEKKVKENAYNSKIQSKVVNMIDKIHFYSGSEKIGEVYLNKTLGWAIFADAIKPMLKDENNGLIAAIYDKATYSASGDAQYATLDLPAVVADGSLSFEELQDAYKTVYDNKVVIIDKSEDEIIAAINKTVENAFAVGSGRPAKKYTGTLTLNEGIEGKEVVYSYADLKFAKDGAEMALTDILKDATGLYDYETVTVKAINDQLGTGDVSKEVEENGSTKLVYGTAKVTVQGTSKAKTGSVSLVQKK